VDDAVRPGVLSAPSVRWPKLSPEGNGINVLTSERLTDAGGGPTFYSCLVEVERAD
jgi:anaerobic selenocysteine-containing dehydrogenase